MGLPCLLLVLAQAQDTPGGTAGSSDSSQARRERLRNFFARRREQRVRPGEGRREGGEEKVRKSVRIVRPQLVKERKEESGQEERVVTSVSVSSSVSTSSKVTRVKPGSQEVTREKSG